MEYHDHNQCHFCRNYPYDYRLDNDKTYKYVICPNHEYIISLNAENYVKSNRLAELSNIEKAMCNKDNSTIIFITLSNNHLSYEQIVRPHWIQN